MSIYAGSGVKKPQRLFTTEKKSRVPRKQHFALLSPSTKCLAINERIVFNFFYDNSNTDFLKTLSSVVKQLKSSVMPSHLTAI